MNKKSEEQQLRDQIKKLEKDLAKMQVLFKKNTAYIKRLELKDREAKRKIRVLEQREAVLQKEIKKREQQWPSPQ